MKTTILAMLLAISWQAVAQNDYLLKPAHVFDGFEMHKDWVVAVKDNQITYAGPEAKLDANKLLNSKA